MSDRRRYIVAYDISEDAIRRRVRQVCRGYGGSEQLSVVEVRLSSAEREELYTRLESLVKEADELAEVRLYSVGPRSNDVVVGGTSSDTSEDSPANVV